MRLKKIEICGFKSFADRVTVKFDVGVTGIVGPNGCGKSNIAESVRWVMGEQSAKSVRSDRMYDLIFAGSEKRKALSFAEVTLVLSEINGELPIDFEEVEIRRRLHRSGESEYFLNGHLVRLKDIQNLLWDTGNAFAHIGQGQVDRMVMLKPQERRLFFDEAAGISRFRQRRKESKNKLDRTEDNLKRLGDIYREVERQKKLLEKQSQEARVFKENKLRLEFLDKAVLLEKWRCLSEQKQGCLDKQEECRQGKEMLEMQQSDKEQAKGTFLQSLKEVQSELSGYQEKYYALKGERDIAQMELQTAKERTKEMGDEKGSLEFELKQLIQQRQKEGKENKQKRQQVESMALSLEKATLLYQESKEKLTVFKESVESLQESQKQTQKEYLQAMQEETRYQSQLQEWQLKLEATAVQIESVKKRKEDLTTKELSLQAEEKEQRAVVSTLSDEIETHKLLQKQFKKKDEETATRVKALELELKTQSNQLTQKQARFQTLESLKKELEGFSGGAKKLLKESQNRESPLYGKIQGLYELLLPKKGNEQVVSLALSRYLQTLVVKTKADERLVWKEIGDKNLKGCSVLCLENIETSSKKGSDLIALVEESSIAHHFFSEVSIGDCFLKNIGECVDEKGYYRDHRGVVFYSSKGEHNIFLREAQLKELHKEIGSLKKTGKELEKELSELIKTSKQIQLERASSDKELRKLEMNHVEANFILQTLVQKRQQTNEEKKSLQKELQEFKTNAETLTLKSKELKGSYKGVKVEIQSCMKQSGDLEKQLEKKLEKLRTDQVTLEAKEQTYHHLKEKYQREENDLKIFAIKEQENLRQQEKLQKEIVNREGSTSHIIERQSVIKENLGILQQQIHEVSLKQRELEKQEKTIRKEVAKQDKELQSLQVELQKTAKASHRLDIQLAETKSAREAILHELDERYQLTFEELLNRGLKLDKPLEEAEKEVKQLYRKVEKADSINLAAIEEFEEVKQRYEELETQIKDLREAKKELETIIKELDEKSRVLFKETFEKVRLSFQKNFTVLFSGGEADLKLIDSQDVLQAGVEINAQPPGKQMRSISLLSGGEKCLTAIALLFALFETKAAPFCILDEIDAPLDDSNVYRFVKLVKEFIHGTQFIIITHNKITMGAADQLYGISMQEKGVSKLLSMSFGKEDKQVDYALVEQ